MKAVGARGFTIVELLIVIVVVAILAAISVVAYNGIQQRANNNALISSVSQTIKVLQAYYSYNNSYPVTNAYACVTTISGCIESSGAVRSANGTFDTNITTIASVPRSTPNVGAAGHGITYHHQDTRQYNGVSKPMLLMYFLDGLSQNCGVPNVMTAWGTPGQDASTSTTGFTHNNTTINKTVCFISVT